MAQAKAAKRARGSLPDGTSGEIAARPSARLIDGLAELRAAVRAVECDQPGAARHFVKLCGSLGIDTASGGPQAVVNALGPSDPGVSRVIRFAQLGGNVIETSVTKTEFSLDPVSDRYGALVLNDGGKSVHAFPERCMEKYGRQLVPLFEALVERGGPGGLRSDGGFFEPLP